MRALSNIAPHVHVRQESDRVGGGPYAQLAAAVPGPVGDPLAWAVNFSDAVDDAVPGLTPALVGVLASSTAPAALEAAWRRAGVALPQPGAAATGLAQLAVAYGHGGPSPGVDKEFDEVWGFGA